MNRPLHLPPERGSNFTKPDNDLTQFYDRKEDHNPPLFTKRFHNTDVWQNDCQVRKQTKNKEK